ncbi:hypothetical protein T265_07934 [Opisthorchis viverrini]|uniref:Uncharacterized protein n=1 Tax=Opisthorchis viverrini TaxID=6198 RepID=A0A074ZLY2_OPIVI|nr:hypothetical protein T265_07934 [Opisthorchis viverrini]KER24375.1 hypothetical protein T265_07934 [Opisthorchis viverrini]
MRGERVTATPPTHADVFTLERCDWCARLIERRPSNCPASIISDKTSDEMVASTKETRPLNDKNLAQPFTFTQAILTETKLKNATHIGWQPYLVMSPTRHSDPADGTTRRPMWHEFICLCAIHGCTWAGILPGRPHLDRRTIRVLNQSLWLKSLTARQRCLAGNANALPFLWNKSPHVPSPNLEGQETVFVRPLTIDQPGMRDSVSVSRYSPV